MRMSHAFATARTAAVHCPELVARGPRPAESAALLAAWRRDLALMLADDLSGLLSGDRLDVTIAEPEPLTGAQALERIGPVAANSLLRVGVTGETALLSFDFGTALALTDRSFGGDGRIGGIMPEALPRSAALMVEEAAGVIAAAITRASQGDTPCSSAPSSACNGEVIVRSESASRLKPFAPEADVLLLEIAIANRQGCQWRANLTLTAERMNRLLPGNGRSPRPSGPRASGSGFAAPFAELPLPLHVVLAEFDLSLSRLQALMPGDTIPLAMGRQVPLMAGETVVAHGSIGTAEDRMAIRLTRLPQAPCAPAIAPAFLPVPASAQGVAP